MLFAQSVCSFTGTTNCPLKTTAVKATLSLAKVHRLAIESADTIDSNCFFRLVTVLCLSLCLLQLPVHFLICMYPNESNATGNECIIWFRQNDLTKIDCYKSANTEAQDTTPGKYRIARSPKMKAR